MGILSGYRVVDLSIAMAGPFAAMRLGDLGADVIKVEPVAGEWQRHTSAGGAAGRQVNASFLSLNRTMFSVGRAAVPPAPAAAFAVDAITAYSAYEGALAA